MQNLSTFCLLVHFSFGRFGGAIILCSLFWNVSSIVKIDQYFVKINPFREKLDQNTKISYPSVRKTLTNWPQFKEFHKCNEIQRRIKSPQKASSGILDWLQRGTFARVPNNKLKCTDQESLTAFQSSSQPWECLKWLDPPGNAHPNTISYEQLVDSWLLTCWQAQHLT